MMFIYLFTCSWLVLFWWQRCFPSCRGIFGRRLAGVCLLFLPWLFFSFGMVVKWQGYYFAAAGANIIKIGF